MTALKREGLGSPDLEIMSRERTDSHTRVWRGTLGREREGKRERDCKFFIDSQLHVDTQSQTVFINPQVIN